MEKYLLPFSEHIRLHTLATLNENKYIFKTQDAWDNIVIGDFYFNDNNIILKMECERSFNLTGKNSAGRQYGGDIHVLKEGNYYF